MLSGVSLIYMYGSRHTNGVDHTDLVTMTQSLFGMSLMSSILDVTDDLAASSRKGLPLLVGKPKRVKVPPQQQHHSELHC